MHDVFDHIKNGGNDAIIISNSNTLFVSWVLKHNNLDNHIHSVKLLYIYIKKKSKNYIIIGIYKSSRN